MSDISRESENPFDLDRLTNAPFEALQGMKDAEVSYLRAIAAQAIASLGLSLSPTIEGTLEQQREHELHLAHVFRERAAHLTSRGAERLFMLPISPGEYDFLVAYLKFKDGSNPSASDIVLRATNRKSYMDRLEAALILQRPVAHFDIDRTDALSAQGGISMSAYERLVKLRDRHYGDELSD